MDENGDSKVQSTNTSAPQDTQNVQAQPLKNGTQPLDISTQTVKSDTQKDPVATTLKYTHKSTLALKIKKWILPSILIVLVLGITSFFVYRTFIHRYGNSIFTKNNSSSLDNNEIADNEVSSNHKELATKDGMTKTKYKALLKTKDGNIQITEDEEYWRFIDNVYKRLYFTESYVYFTEDNILKKINRNTKVLSEIKIPDDIYKLISDRDDPFPDRFFFKLDQLNENKAIVEFFPYEIKKYVYLLDIDKETFKLSKTLKGMNGVENPGNSFYHRLTDNYALFAKWQGEALFSNMGGTIYLYNIGSDSKEEIFRTTPNKELIGILNDKLIVADYTFDPNTENNTYQKIYQIDPLTLKQTLLFTQNQFPDKNTHSLSIYDSERLVMTINKDGNLDNAYLLNIKTKDITPMLFTSAKRDELKKSRFDEYKEKNSDLLIVEQEETYR